MTEVEEYLSKLPQAQHKELTRVRNIVKKVVPQAVESFSYGMPTYKYKKRPLIYLGAFKNHMSLFPASSKVLASLKDELSKFKTSKGTLQFNEDDSLSDELIEQIITRRKQEIDTL